MSHEQPTKQLTDPYPTKDRFIGRTVSFDYLFGGTVRRLVGTVEKQTFIGYTKHGHIPDYHLVVRGNSGKAVTISLVENYTLFT